MPVSFTRTVRASTMLNRPAATAIQPSQLKCMRCPPGCLDTIQPPTVELTPDARSRAQLVRLKNAPRREEGTASVTIAWPGTKRPLAKTKKSPDNTSVVQIGNGPAFAIASIMIDAATTIYVNTRCRP